MESEANHFVPEDYPLQRYPKAQHSSLIEEVAAAGQVIESIRDEEIRQYGVDPLAVELLP